MSHACDYIVSNNDEYGLSDCSGKEKCIGGQVRGDVEDGVLNMI